MSWRVASLVAEVRLGQTVGPALDELESLLEQGSTPLIELRSLALLLC